MKSIAPHLAALCVALVGCAGHAASTAPDDAIAWTPEIGLEAVLDVRAGAGEVLEIGQALRGPVSVRFDAVTLAGEPIAGVALEQSADPNGAAVLVLRFTREEVLDAGTVVGSRLVRTGDGTLVRPAWAWFVVDGVERARRQW
jgi:hypothetical protein